MTEAFRAETLGGALEALAAAPRMILAGGTDLMVRRRGWSGTLPAFDSPALFVGEIPELRGVTAEPGGSLVLGAAVKLAEAQADERVPGILRTALRSMASPAIRNMGTLGGNICNASPAGDTLPVLYALGASLRLQSVRGAREMPINQFITGPGRKALAPDELLTAVLLPAGDFTGGFYRKVGARKADAISKLSFAGLYTVRDGVLQTLRIAIGAVGPTVVRLPEAEKQLAGKRVEWLHTHADDAAALYEAAVRPIDDQRSTAVYRKAVALGLIRQFIAGIS